MKKSTITFTATLFIFQIAISQQWVEKQYQYDSLLNVRYGISIDFNV